MSRNPARTRVTTQRRSGPGAGAWRRRRRHQVPESRAEDSLVSAVSDVLSLSLDGDEQGERSAVREIGGRRLRGPTSTPTPPQAPPPNSSAGDSPAPTLPNTNDLVLVELAGGADEASLSSTSLEIETAAQSSPGSSAVLTGTERAVAPSDPNAFVVEEETEAVDVELPAPLALTLAEEVLPWPPVLVDPTLVILGAWPPVDGGRAEPSFETHGDGLHEGISGDVSIGSVSVELIIEDDPSVADVGVLLGYVESSEVPPVRGTLDEMPVVSRPSGRATEARVITVDDPVHEPLPPHAAGDLEETPTEVSARDALEDALAVLRTTEPQTLLRTSSAPLVDDHSEDTEEAATTAEDLVSLEFMSDEESRVDPAVRSDMERSADVARTRDRTWLVLGGPSLEDALGANQRSWIDLTLDGSAPLRRDAKSLPPRPPSFNEPISETTTDLRALAARGRSSQRADIRADMSPNAEDGVGDDWLSDLAGDDVS